MPCGIQHSIQQHCWVVKNICAADCVMINTLQN